MLLWSIGLMLAIGFAMYEYQVWDEINRGKVSIYTSILNSFEKLTSENITESKKYLSIILLIEISIFGAGLIILLPVILLTTRLIGSKELRHLRMLIKSNLNKYKTDPEYRNRAALNLLFSHTLKNTINSSLFKYIVASDKIPIEERFNFFSNQSRFFSDLYNYSSEQFISLRDEIEFVKLFCSLFEELKIEVEVKIKNIENIENIMVPPLLTLNIIENSITKGFKRDNKSSNKILIKIKMRTDSLFEKPVNCFDISIIDNGIGSKSYELIKESIHRNLESIPNSGKGLTNLQERINAFNASQGRVMIDLTSNEISTDYERSKYGFSTGLITKISLINYEYFNS